MPWQPDPSQLRTPDGNWVAPEELREILANEGYSGDQRDMFLKAALTELTQASVTPGHTERREALLDEVRAILSDEQDKSGQRPISDDTL